MKKPVKIVGGSLAGLAVVVGVIAAAAVFLSERKMQRVVEAPIPAVDLSAIDADLARGRYIFVTRGCADCHGAGGEGRVMIDDKNRGFYVSAPNITRGSGPAAAYSDADWIAVLRHGLKPARTPVFIMPSIDYAQMADADVASLVAYIRSLPPTPEKRAEIRLPLMLKALYAFGALTDSAEKIDHTRLAPARVPEGQHEQGAYVANTCMGCHGEGLAGGKIPGTPPDCKRSKKRVLA